MLNGTVSTSRKHCSTESAAEWQQPFLRVESSSYPNAGVPVIAPRGFNPPNDSLGRFVVKVARVVASYGSERVAPVGITVADLHPPWNTFIAPLRQLFVAAE